MDQLNNLKLWYKAEELCKLMHFVVYKRPGYIINNDIVNQFNVKIVELNKNRCLELSELLPKASIICGDGTSQNVLSEEGLKQSDAIISLTGLDEENIIISLTHALGPCVITGVDDKSFQYLVMPVKITSKTV